MDLKRCTKCLLDKPFGEFNFKYKSRGIYQYHCKICARSLIRNHYNNNKGYYLAKAKIRNDEFKLKIHGYIKNYFSSHPCVDCGETDPAVLEVDHTGETRKLKAVSQLMRSQYPFEKIVEEIDKCEVRCANCHRRKTAKQFKWYKLKMPL